MRDRICFLERCESVRGLPVQRIRWTPVSHAPENNPSIHFRCASHPRRTSGWSSPRNKKLVHGLTLSDSHPLAAVVESVTLSFVLVSKSLAS
jgi:hypothetical protein